MSNTYLPNSSQQIKPPFNHQDEAAFLVEFSHFIQEEEKALQELKSALKDLSACLYGL